MSIKRLPRIEARTVPNSVEWDIPLSVMSKWNPNVKAKEDDKPATINIYEGIGESWDGSGMTSSRVAGMLRSIGERDITVSINSPGGDFFEGIAIYNMLREHKGKITVKVPGIAASAASIIAMAGDEIQIGKAAFLMIHNAWSIVMGNRNDLAEVAEVLGQFDNAMADVYSDRTGADKKAIAKMMDRDTWMSGSEAIDLGFADEYLDADQIDEEEDDEKKTKLAKAEMDAALAKQGLTRSQRRDLYKRAGMQNATGADTHNAVNEGEAKVHDALNKLLDMIRS